jgi:hypothetical protein
MSSAADADQWFAGYGVTDIVRVSDLDKALYRQFGLDQATFAALAHPRVWWPWFRTAVLHAHGVGRAGANWRQLTGAFVIHRGTILGAVRHRNSAARPDYLAMVTAATSSSSRS